MKKRVLVLFLAVVLAAGCAPTAWQSKAEMTATVRTSLRATPQQGQGSEQTDRDWTACVATVGAGHFITGPGTVVTALLLWPVAATGWPQYHDQQANLTDCMTAKGYTVSTVEPP